MTTSPCNMIFVVFTAPCWRNGSAQMRPLPKPCFSNPMLPCLLLCKIDPILGYGQSRLGCASIHLGFASIHLGFASTPPEITRATGGFHPNQGFRPDRHEGHTANPYTGMTLLP